MISGKFPRILQLINILLVSLGQREIYRIMRKHFELIESKNTAKKSMMELM